jgi:hypothetical protein
MGMVRRSPIHEICPCDSNIGPTYELLFILLTTMVNATQ